MSSFCCSSSARRVGQQRQEPRQLRALVAADLVHVEQLADLRQRQPEPLAAQDQLDPHALALAVHALARRAAPAPPDHSPRRSGSRASSARTRARGRKSSTSACVRTLQERRRGGRRASRADRGRRGRARRATRRRRERMKSDATIPYRINLAAAAMSAPHPTVLDFPFPAPPPPGEVIEVAPGILWLRMPLPFALDHINLWLLRERGAFHARRLRLRRRADARAVGTAFRARWRRAALAHRRHALPSRPLRQRRVADGALRLPDRDDAGRVPERVRHLRPGGDARACGHLRALPPPRHVRRASSTRSPAAAITIAAASPSRRRRSGG